MESIGFILNKEKLDKKKYIPINLEITSLWHNYGEEITDFLVKVDLLNFAEKVISSSEMPVPKPKTDFDSGKMKSATTRISINRLPITEAGFYFFKVWQEDKKDKKFNLVAELPFEIKIKYQEKDVKK